MGRLSDFLNRHRDTYPWRVETSGNQLRPETVHKELGEMTKFIRVPQMGPNGEMYAIWGFEYSEDRDLFIRTYCTRTRIGNRYRTSGDHNEES